jgi:hypothetical protein
VIEIDHSRYLKSWARELASQAGRIRDLIGPVHWLSDGHHKEAILRDFISRYLPPSIIVANGFIVSMSGKLPCSPELDILIANTNIEAPLLFQSGICITTPNSVLAHIQVKTTFGKAELVLALENVAIAQKVIASTAEPERIWRGIVFYECPESRTDESILNTLEAGIRSLHAKYADGGGDFQPLLPTCIACLDKWVVFISRDSVDVVLRFFGATDLSIACAMADLFGTVRRGIGGPVLDKLSDMIASVVDNHPIHRVIKLDLTP